MSLSNTRSPSPRSSPQLPSSLSQRRLLQTPDFTAQKPKPAGASLPGTPSGQQHCCAHPAAGCPHPVPLVAQASPAPGPGTAQPLTGTPQAAPCWMAQSVLKHIQLLYLTVACYAHYSIKDFICSHCCNVYSPNSFNSGLLTKCFPSSGNYIHSPKQTLAR